MHSRRTRTALRLECNVCAASDRDAGHVRLQRLGRHAAAAAREAWAALELAAALVVTRRRRRGGRRWGRRGLDVAALPFNHRAAEDQLVVIDAPVKAAALALGAAVQRRRWRRRRWLGIAAAPEDQGAAHDRRDLVVEAPGSTAELALGAAVVFNGHCSMWASGLRCHGAP